MTKRKIQHGFQLTRLDAAFKKESVKKFKKIKGVKKYKTISRTVEAVRFTGKNDLVVMTFCPASRDPEDIKANWIIPTPAGEQLASLGDWIVRDSYGDFWVLQNRQFCAKYEPKAERTSGKVSDLPKDLRARFGL